MVLERFATKLFSRFWRMTQSKKIWLEKKIYKKQNASLLQEDPDGTYDNGGHVHMSQVTYNS